MMLDSPEGLQPGLLLLLLLLAFYSASLFPEITPGLAVSSK